MKTIFFILSFITYNSAFSFVDNNFLTPMGSVEGITGNTGIARLGSIGSVIYNPAGLAFSTDKKISIAGSAYTQNSISLDSELIKAKASFFQSTPSQVTTVFNKWGYALAFSVLVPKVYKFDYNLDVVNNNIEFQSYNTYESEETYFGPTIAKKFGKRFSIGTSIFLVKKSLNTSSNDFTLIDNNNFGQIFDSTKIEGYTLLGSFGATIHLMPRLIMGFKLSTPQINLSSTFNQNATSISTDTGLSAEKKKDGEASFFSPAELAGGLQFRISNKMKLLTDIAIHTGMKSTIIEKDAKGDKLEKEYLSSLRAHVGFEYRFSQNESFNFGAQYNQKNSDDSFDFFGFQAGYRKKEEIADSIIGFFINKNIEKEEEGVKINYLMAGIYLSTSINFVK